MPNMYMSYNSFKIGKEKADRTPEGNRQAHNYSQRFRHSLSISDRTCRKSFIRPRQSWPQQHYQPS